MKHYLIAFSLWFVSNQLQAQQLYAEYDYMPSPMVIFKERVYFDKDTKIVVRDSVPQQKKAKEEAGSDDAAASEGVFTIDMGTIFRNVIIQKTGQRSLLETRSLEGKNYRLTDSFPALEWNTNYAETEKVDTYTCHKATAKYRGATLVAYYTNDIPMPAGPYKFGGLPGLIVLLYNESAHPNYWMLSKVEYPYKGSIPVNLNYINSLPSTTLQKLITREEMVIEEKMRVIQSKLPPGVEIDNTTNEKVRGSVEQVYEWETAKP